LLVLLTCAVYLPVLKCGFIIDDDDYVQNNLTLRSLQGLARIWLDPSATPQYYPLTFTTFWVEYHLWELNPLGYHIINVLLHCAGVVLLWRVLKLLEIPGAWVAAAIFAVHPVHVQSVAWITERKNVLSGVFYFAAALTYLRWTMSGTDRTADGSCKAVRSKESIAARAAPRPNRLYWLSLILFVCALCGKTVTGTLPAALLLVQWWKAGRLEWRHVRALSPFFVLGLALNIFIAWREEFVLCADRDWNFSFVEKCVIAGRAIWFYVGKLLWPDPLIFSYPRWRMDPAAWRQWLSLVAALVVVGGLWLGRRRLGRGPLVAVLFFGGTLFPSLGFFNVGWLQYSFVADYFVHLASVGPIVMLTALGAVYLYRRSRRGAWAGMVLVVLVLATLGVRTSQRVEAYTGLETLWRDTAIQNPGCWQAHYNLGYLVHQKGQLDEAMVHYRKAEQIKPNEPATLISIAAMSEARGNLAEAVRYYRLILESRPSNAASHNNLGLILLAQGKAEEAIEHFQRALTVSPNAALIWFNLGLALQACGDLDAALVQFRRALELNPDWPAAMGATAWLLATHPDADVRRPQEAISLAERARLLPHDQDAALIDTLAAAYAAAGQFERALITAKAAEAAASQSGAEELARKIHLRVQLYAQNKPYMSALAEERTVPAESEDPR
jgi:tetratricopeptide (TPR) repeat protein